MDQPDPTDGLQVEGHLLWPAAVDVVIPGTGETKQITLPRNLRIRVAIDPDWPQRVGEYDKMEAAIFGRCIELDAIPPEFQELLDSQDSS